MKNAVYLRAKDPVEVIPLTWIFDRPVVSAVVQNTIEHIGPIPDINQVDTNPALMLDMLLWDGRSVVQYVKGGFDLHTYRLEVIATLIDNTVITSIAYIPVKQQA